MKQITPISHIFFWRIANFMSILEMQKKIQKIIFDFEIFAFELVALDTLFYWETIHFIGCQYVNKESQDFRYYQNRIFRADYLSEWPEKMTKIRLCRFKQCFVPFNMLAFLKCSDTGLCRHLSNPAFCSLWFKKQITFEPHLLCQSISNIM